MTKFAVVKIAGKQYLVQPGMKLKTDKMNLPEKGEEIKFADVLIAGDDDKVSIGRPLVSGAEVKAEVLGNKRAKKVIAFRYRPKARVRVKRGHRQHYSEFLIKGINL